MAGRPPTPIDYALVERLAHIHCTDDEIATLIGMSKDNFCKRKHRDKQLCLCLEKGRDGGKMSLRRMQWKSAEGGNVTAQIWLGKQLLGQRDKQEVTGKDGGPMEHRIDLKALSDDELDRLIETGRIDREGPKGEGAA
jgi:hypothetical protein